MESATPRLRADMQRALLLIVLSMVAFGAVACAVFHGPLGRFDVWLSEAIVPWRTPSMNWFFIAVTKLGTTRWLVVASCLSLPLAIYRPIRRELLLVFALLVVVWASSVVLKDAFKRPRPVAPAVQHETSWSFPSGHAMVSISLFVFLACVARARLRQKWHALAIVACTLATLLIGISRIYVGVHYFGDVLAGYLAGLPVAVAAIVVYNYPTTPAGEIAAERKRLLDAQA